MKSSLINDIEIEGVRDALNILAKAGTEDLFEKAKHQIGDSHPKWPQLKWTDLGGGKFGWRTGTGRGKRAKVADQASSSNTSNSGGSTSQADYAKETDTKTLKNVANSDKAPKELKDAAKKELQNRGEQVQPAKTDTTEKKEDKKLRPVGTGTNGPERRKKEAPQAKPAKTTSTEKKRENIEISSIKDKALREKITRYVEEATDGEYAESDYTWKDVLTALRNPSEKEVRERLEEEFGVTVDLASNDDKKKSENSGSMSAEQIFKKYNIPEATVEEIYTKRGYEYDRDTQTSSIRNKRFVSELKSAVDKYGAPIKVEKQNVNTYNEQVARYNANRELEYQYLKGTIVNVTFKDSEGQTHVVRSYRSRLSL